jgi:hypothetical protein
MNYIFGFQSKGMFIHAPQMLSAGCGHILNMCNYAQISYYTLESVTKCAIRRQLGYLHLWENVDQFRLVGQGASTFVSDCLRIKAHVHLVKHKVNITIRTLPITLAK